MLFPYFPGKSSRIHVLRSLLGTQTEIYNSGLLHRAASRLQFLLLINHVGPAAAAALENFQGSRVNAFNIRNGRILYLRSFPSALARPIAINNLISESILASGQILKWRCITSLLHTFDLT